ncbi:MAG: hypothetical protein PHF20_09220 [Halothiobacillaceae bacterium]|nr:hypothetical protein [Halothiobacillaceae bacterium]
MRFELPILAQSALGAFSQISLHWPDALPTPLPGERLQLHDGEVLYPMLNTHPGRLEALSARAHSEPRLKLAAVTGERIHLSPDQPVVILAAGIALATLIQLCATRRQATASTLALYQMSGQMSGSIHESAPFRPRPSRFLLDGMPAGVIAAIPLLEDWGIPSRLCTHDGLAGCFEGSLDELIAQLPHSPQCQLVRLADAQ